MRKLGDKYRIIEEELPWQAAADKKQYQNSRWREPSAFQSQGIINLSRAGKPRWKWEESDWAIRVYPVQGKKTSVERVSVKNKKRTGGNASAGRDGSVDGASGTSAATIVWKGKLTRWVKVG